MSGYCQVRKLYPWRKSLKDLYAKTIENDDKTYHLYFK